jgi:hypothetical protein
MLHAVSKRDAGFKCKAMVKTILLLDDHACWQVKYAISSHAVDLSLFSFRACAIFAQTLASTVALRRSSVCYTLRST